MSTKKRCEGPCKRLLRTCKLKKNRITEQLLCKRCMKQIGENKFYTPIPLSSRYQRISKYSITDAEKIVLRKRKSYKDINKLVGQLKGMRKTSRINKANEKKEIAGKEVTKKENKKAFLEGLK